MSGLTLSTLSRDALQGLIQRRLGALAKLHARCTPGAMHRVEAQAFELEGLATCLGLTINVPVCFHPENGVRWDRRAWP